MSQPDYIFRSGDLPISEHFAVLADGKIMPAEPNLRSTQYLEYLCFSTQEALSQWVAENNGKRIFQVVCVKPVKYELHTTMTLKL